MDIKMLCTKRYLVTVHSMAEKQSQTYMNLKEACGSVRDQFGPFAWLEIALAGSGTPPRLPVQQRVLFPHVCINRSKKKYIFIHGTFIDLQKYCALCGGIAFGLDC